MKTRFSSKTSTRLAAVIAVIAVTGSFAGDNDQGYCVVAQTLEGITTVAVYDSANNPGASVAGVG